MANTVPPPTASLRELLDALDQLRPWLQPLDMGRYRELLHAVAVRGDSDALPRLATWAFEDDPEVARLAAEVAAELFGRARVAALPTLDQLIRHAYVFGRPWYRLEPSVLANKLLPGEAGFAQLALAVSHRNGFVREAAVVELTRRHDGRELPFLLLRLNDWVVPVHQRALAAVEARLQPEYAHALTGSLPLLHYLQGVERRDLVPQVARALTLLTQPESVPALRAGLAAGDQDVRRASHRLALTPEHPLRQEAITGGLEHPDAVVRTASIRASDTLPDAEAKELLLSARRDPHLPARREALWRLAERFPAEAAPMLQDALLDRSASIRHLARFYLGRMGESGFAEVYRRAIHQGRDPQLASAISGLMETGDASDTPLIEPFLDHARTNVQAAATRALGRLALRTYRERLLDLLEHAPSRVAREAALALEVEPYALPLDRLWSLVTEPAPPHRRRLALRLIARLDPWTRLPYLVRAISLDDELLVQQASTHLDIWMRQSTRLYTRPTNEQKAAIERALREQGSRLIPQCREYLEYLLSVTS